MSSSVHPSPVQNELIRRDRIGVSHAATETSKAAKRIRYVLPVFS